MRRSTLVLAWVWVFLGFGLSVLNAVRAVQAGAWPYAPLGILLFSAAWAGPGMLLLRNIEFGWWAIVLASVVGSALSVGRIASGGPVPLYAGLVSAFVISLLAALWDLPAGWRVARPCADAPQVSAWVLRRPLRIAAWVGGLIGVSALFANLDLIPEQLAQHGAISAQAVPRLQGDLMGPVACLMLCCLLWLRLLQRREWVRSLVIVLSSLAVFCLLVGTLLQASNLLPARGLPARAPLLLHTGPKAWLFLGDVTALMLAVGLAALPAHLLALDAHGKTWRRTRAVAAVLLAVTLAGVFLFLDRLLSTPIGERASDSIAGSMAGLAMAIVFFGVLNAPLWAWWIRGAPASVDASRSEEKTD